MKQIREPLGLISVHGNLGILYQVRNALLFQNALRQLRKRYGDEGIQLRVALDALVLAIGSDYAAGANVEANR
jgi:hypothetical protein